MTLKLTYGTYFVTGTDTDVGKTVATGFLARELERTLKCRVATFKLVQTGCTSGSIDIALHRRIMGKVLTEDNAQGPGITAPLIYAFPASPHLAAELDHRSVDLDALAHPLALLKAHYDIVLIEGAGGLMVPLTRELLTIDYAAEQGWPVIFVTSGRLGSINHTLLAWEALERRGMPLAAVVYNAFCGVETPNVIVSDTRDYLKDKLAKHHPEALWVELPKLDLGKPYGA